MSQKTFHKNLGEVQVFFLDFNNKKIRYTIEYTGEDEYGDGSVFRVICRDARIDQEFLEEDLNLIIHTVIPESLEDIERETLQSLTLRVFENDVNFLKKYASERNMKYQTLMRDMIRKGTKELQL